MLEMLCAIPSPCGGEEIAKKYIMQKHPECYEDSFGNLIRKIGSGDKKILIYSALDEDGAVALNVVGDKVSFAHLGSRKIYPGQAVSFGGYNGFVCADGENPSENQYIKLVDCADGIDVGRVGTFEDDFEGDIENENETLLGKNVASRAAISAFLQTDTAKYEVYFVCGVQTNNKSKGLSAAISNINPDEVLVFEETDKEKFVIKLLGAGYACGKEQEKKAEAVFEKVKIEFEKTADTKEYTIASVTPWGKTCVIGIPVTFSDFIRQGIKGKTVKDLTKFIKTYAEEE